MKTGMLKILKRDAEILNPIIKDYTKIAIELEKFVLTLGGIVVIKKSPKKGEEDKIIFNGKEELNKLCSKYEDERLRETLKQACLNVYNWFISQKIMASAVDVDGQIKNGSTSITPNKLAVRFLGGNTGRISRPTKTFLNRQFLNIVDQTLDLLREHQILPMKYPDGVLSDNYKGGYKRSITRMIYARLSSYNDQIKNINEENEKLIQEYESGMEKLETEYNSADINSLREFIKDLNEEKGVLGFKLISYIKNNPTLPEKGYWLDSNGKKVTYMVPQSILNVIKKYENLWNVRVNPNPILLNESLIQYINLFKLIFKKRKIPSYTLLHEWSGEFRLSTLSNAVSVRKIESNFPNITLTISHPYKKDPIIINGSYRRYAKGKNHKGKPSGKHYYFENLTITKKQPEKKKTAKNEPEEQYKFSFSINGKQPIDGIVKEPVIYYRKKGTFLSLPINIEKTKEQENLYKIRKNIIFKLMESYPEKEKSKELNKQSSKQIEIPNLQTLTTDKKDKRSLSESIHDLGRPLRLLGVDLGMSETGVALFEMDENFNIKDLNITEIKSVDENERRNYYNFERKILHLQNQIQIINEWCSNNDDSIIKNKEHLNWLKNEKINYENKIEKSKNDSQNQRRNKETFFEFIRKNKSWVISNEFWKLREELKQIIKNRNEKYDWVNNLYWANIIEEYISLHKSYFDLRNDHGKIQFSKKGICKKYYRLNRGIREDYAKKMANYVVMFAKKHDVDIIAVEQLNSNLGDKDRKTTKDNRTFNRWNCGRVKEHIKNMAIDYNIFLIEIDEYGTSQYHFETKKPGYREGCYLYLENEKVNANINAAKNIAEKALSQHTIIYSLNLEKINDMSTNNENLYQVHYKSQSVKNRDKKPKKSSKNTKGSLRLRGAITRQYGYSDVIFSSKEYPDLSSGINQIKLKRIGNNFVSEEKYKKYIESIQLKCM